MSITESLAARRTYYALDKNLPVSQDEVVDIVKKTTELVPDAPHPGSGSPYRSRR